MNFRFLLLLLSLLAVSSFATVLPTDTPTCNISYNDSFSIRVLDAKFRPVPDADVFVRYQYSGSVGTEGKGTYHILGPKVTNQSGMVNVYISNIETVKSRLECGIDINASIGGTTSTKETFANAHSNPVDVQVNVYPVQFFVHDQRNVPIAGAKVTVGTEDGSTNENGYVTIFAPKGKANYLISYKDGKQTGSFTVNDDVVYSAVLPYNSLAFDVVDDLGNTLAATVFFQNKSVELGPDGHYFNPSIFGDQIDFTVTYSGITKQLTMFPVVENTTRVVFDFGSPTLANVTQSTADGSTRLFINIFDPGQYASGVNPSSVQVTYRTESGTQYTDWTKATAYAISKNNFAVDFPSFAPNSIVKFKIEASDREGNRASLTGSFTVVAAEPANNDTTPPQQETPAGNGSSLIYMSGAALIIILIVFVVFRLKKGGD